MSKHARHKLGQQLIIWRHLGIGGQLKGEALAPISACEVTFQDSMFSGKMVENVPAIGG
jgi:hypothetical protein